MRGGTRSPRMEPLPVARSKPQVTGYLQAMSAMRRAPAPALARRQRRSSASRVRVPVRQWISLRAVMRRRAARRGEFRPASTARAFLTAAKSNYVEAAAGVGQRQISPSYREFTSNDMFIALTHELRARAGQSNDGSGRRLDAELLGIESTADEHIASVKFDGTLRVDGEIERVSEVWNLAKPVRGGGWVLAGIQQLA